MKAPKSASPASSVPVLASTDAAGVEWSFDPTTGRWAARSADKKASSQAFETLKTKVSGWTPNAQGLRRRRGTPAAPATAPSEPSEPFEVALVSVLHKLPRFDVVDLLVAPELVPTVVAVKVDWDAGAGELRRLRYKKADDKGGAWHSSGVNTMTGVDLGALDAASLEWWGKLFGARAEMRCIEKAARTIAAEWEGTKEDRAEFRVSSRKVHRGAKGEPDTYSDTWEQVERPKKDWGWYGVASPSGIPFLYGDALTDMSQWSAQDDGSWRRGETTVRLVMERSPTFTVEHTANGTREVVLSTSTWSVALRAANATFLVEEAAAPVLELWVRTEMDWKDKPFGRWPERVNVRAAAILSGRQHVRMEDELNLLKQSFGKTRVGAESAPYPVWVGSYGAVHKHELAWYDTGPADAPALAAIAALRTLHREVSKPWKVESVQAELESQTKASLQLGYSREGDGEEPPGAEALLKQWTLHVERWEKAAASSPALKTTAARCDEIVSAALDEMRAAVASARRPSASRAAP